MQRAQDVPQREARLRVEPHRRLVEKDDVRLVDQRARDHQALLLSARHLVDLGVRLVGDAQLLEQLHGARHGLRGADAEVRGVKLEVLDDVQAAVGIRPLRDDADSPAHAHRVGPDVGAADDAPCPRSGGRAS